MPLKHAILVAKFLELLLKLLILGARRRINIAVLAWAFAVVWFFGHGTLTKAEFYLPYSNGLGPFNLDCVVVPKARALQIRGCLLKLLRFFELKFAETFLRLFE